MSTERTKLLIGFIENRLMSGRGSRELTGDDDLLGSGILDSLGAFQLVFFIEEEFGIEVPAQDVTIENFSTVSAIEAYLSSQDP